MSTIGMDFGRALVFLKEGGYVTRQNWNGKGQYVYLTGAQYPALPYLSIKTAQDETVPWTASQSDLLANDWQTVDEETLKNGGR